MKELAWCFLFPRRCQRVRGLDGRQGRGPLRRSAHQSSGTLGLVPSTSLWLLTVDDLVSGGERLDHQPGLPQQRLVGGGRRRRRRRRPGPSGAAHRRHDVLVVRPQDRIAPDGRRRRPGGARRPVDAQGGLRLRRRPRRTAPDHPARQGETKNGPASAESIGRRGVFAGAGLRSDAGHRG